ncbi:phage resistance protein [Pseudanabaena sp. UWO311]|uniref:phage resistance protein n=1 Tax=Pseudanabaena sp. UWO311 TaxID=2487337 RepID=UPI00115BFCD5|nr:phage resistance protein [Pseudanabaena sp. UWO311]TYQ28695.1 phage resistance protein [Pseudanabaena sp. UWO311]
MTLLKDLIEIPESLQKGDFVLNLSSVANDADKILRDYVVTPELQKCFEKALNFIRSTLQTNVSKATYLHGSFGSGKSHFMAVLYLILKGNLTARSINELAPVIAKNNEWVTGKKFLLVPYHAIGSENMESCILGGYVDFIRRTHPEAPIPGVYLAEGMFQDAANLRSQMGDVAFFAALNGANATNTGWGEIAANDWNVESFEKATNAPPATEVRSQIIGALIKAFFNSYDQQAKGEAFLSLDKGLSVISQHAKSLGYDALILFLDELILWLASRATDLSFIHREGQKLSKLVEAQTPDRPIPIVSFVARQRDLSDLIGNAVPGAERLNFSDALKHWEGRFDRIVLEDRNLPAIAQKRVLRPKNPAATTEIDAAFDKTLSIREAAMNVLLTREGDREMFRQVYPFSPALIQALIAVSSVLQRERTALKIMVQMLVDRRDYLAVGDILPVGDLFDAIAHGDESFSPETAFHFDNAKRLYHQKLLPMIEKQHGLRREEFELLLENDPKRIAFFNDDRLIKTLLLSALVPEVEVLRSLTPERLSALNHGTIKAPIPGREGQIVLQKCRQWAGTIGEIRLTEGNMPTISIQLSGVDTESIIAQGKREDNHGNRIRLVRDLLFKQLNIQGEDELEQSFTHLWKNTRRSCTVMFRNIRELPFTVLENNSDRWKIIIDYPFDVDTHTPRDDISRIQSFSEDHPQGAKTLGWIPAFLSEDALTDLGMLVTLEHILAGTGERFAQFANNLSAQDRQAAKSLLENQRSSLHQRVLHHLEVVYGLESSDTNSINSARSLELNERFQSLYEGLQLQPPVASTLRDALTNLLEQALVYEFPSAPEFEAEIEASNNLEKVYRVILDATQQNDGRIAIEDRKLRLLVRQIANPLLLGEMAPDATHFVLGQHWKQLFTRKIAEAGGAISVGQLRRWLDELKPMGLPAIAQNLVILIFTAQTNRLAYRSNLAIEPTLKSLPDDIEFRTQQLPDEAIWQVALDRASSIFNVQISRLLNAQNVAILNEQIANLASENIDHAKHYANILTDSIKRFAIANQINKNCDRLQTALAISHALERLKASKSEDVINILADITIATSETAMKECFRQLKTLGKSLDRANWEILSAIQVISQDITDERSAEVKTLLDNLTYALSGDEYAIALSPVLKDSEAKATRILTAKPKNIPLPTSAPFPLLPNQPTQIAADSTKPLTHTQSLATNINPTITPAPPLPTSEQIISQENHENINLAEAEQLLSSLKSQQKQNQKIRINLSWIVE